MLLRVVRNEWRGLAADRTLWGSDDLARRGDALRRLERCPVVGPAARAAWQTDR